MTALAITPNFDKKTAKFKGAIAAGEHVAVTIQNDGEYVASTTNLRLRVVDPVCGKTLAIFPQPVEEGETPETWDSDLTPLSCELNLNTDRMLKAVPPAATVPLLFVLDDKEADTLYFKDMCEVTHWPQVRGEDEPYNLDDYPDIIEDFKDRLADAESDIADAVSDVAQAVESVNTAIYGIDGKVSAAVSSAVPAAVADKADKVEDAVAGNFAGLNSSGNLTDSGKKPADFAPASHVADGNIHVTAQQKAAWSAKQDAISDLSDIRAKAKSAYQVPDGGIPKSALHAEVQESLGKADSTASEILGCINAAEFDSDSKKIVFKHDTTTVAEIDATDFIKDGMVSSVEIDDGKLVITFNTDAGQEPIEIPLTDIFNPDNYYNKTAADGKFVAKADVAATVTQDSANPVKSSGIWSALWGALAALPTGFSSLYDWCVAQLAGKASTADATLNLRGPNHDGLSAWNVQPVYPAGYTGYTGPNWDDSHLLWVITFTGHPINPDVSMPAESGNTRSSLSITFANGTTATRTALPGYILGPDDPSKPNYDKPLASEAEAEALRTGKQNALSPTQLANIAAVSDALAFDATHSYSAGDPVVYDGTLYTFTAAHTGAWTESDVSAVDIIARLDGKLDKSGGTVTGDLVMSLTNIGKGLALTKNSALGNLDWRLFVDSSSRLAFYSLGDWYTATLRRRAGTIAFLDEIGITAFDATATYAVGAKVVYDNAVWNCTTAVSTAGAWSTVGSNFTKLFDLDTGAPASGGTKLITNGQAFTVLQGKADVSAIPYSLVTQPIVGNGVILEDRASNAVTISTTLSPNTLTINFPTATSGKVRDFAMRLNIAAGVTAPEIAWPQGVTLENDGGEVPEIADGGTGGSSTILYFSETENDGTTAKFLVKGETLTAIAQA